MEGNPRMSTRGGRQVCGSGSAVTAEHHNSKVTFWETLRPSAGLVSFDSHIAKGITAWCTHIPDKWNVQPPDCLGSKVGWKLLVQIPVFTLVLPARLCGKQVGLKCLNHFGLGVNGGPSSALTCLCSHPVASLKRGRGGRADAQEASD